MGVFSGMKEAKPTVGGLYVEPGNYLLQVNRVKLQDAQDPRSKKKWYIVETLVKESEQTDPENKPNPVGTEPAWLVELPGDYPDLSLGNIKNFLKAGYGALAVADGEEGPEDDDIDEEMSDDSVSKENPLAGVLLNAKAFHKPTKKGGKFTRVSWSVPGQEEDDGDDDS